MTQGKSIAVFHVQNTFSIRAAGRQVFVLDGEVIAGTISIGMALMHDVKTSKTFPVQGVEFIDDLD